MTIASADPACTRCLRKISKTPDLSFSFAGKIRIRLKSNRGLTDKVLADVRLFEGESSIAAAEWKM